MQALKKGDRLRAKLSQMTCEVAEYIAGGGQGEVYAVRLGGDRFALKWYLPDSATPTQLAILQKLIEIGPPTERFLWPFDLVASDRHREFGYLMPFRPAEYRGLDDVVYDKAPCTYRPLVTAALQLVDSYFQLHAKGLCYCDISYRNICIRPTTGDILVMDNDNVTVNRSGLSGVAGTLPFMAPEVIRGETMPSRETDLYSLAVLLFGMFMRDHPMHGKKESAIRILDENAQDKLYGFEPVFMFDPRDDSNRPDPRWHAAALDLWPRYPQFFRDLFTTSFTDGVRDPDHGRVRETVWRKKLIALRDAIVYGPCGAENFYCEDYRRKHEGRLRPCWQHGDRGETVTIPFRLEVNQQLVVLNYDAKVFPHHLDERRSLDFSAPAAEVAQHPTDPSIWGLKNLTPRHWVIRTSNGVSKEVTPGKSIILADGTEIDFGSAKGVIRL